MSQVKTIDFFPDVKIIIEHQRLIEAVLEYVEKLADKPLELIPNDLLKDPLMKQSLSRALATASRNLMEESEMKKRS